MNLNQNRNQNAAASSNAGTSAIKLNDLLFELDSHYQARTTEEKLFLKNLHTYVQTHYEASVRNKDAYFGNNERSGISAYLLSLLETFLRSPMLQGLVFWIILHYLSFRFKPGQAMLEQIASGQVTLEQILSGQKHSLFFDALLGIISFAVALLSARQNWHRRTMALRRYGETWVRHSYMLTKYQDEILRYLSATAPYNTLY